MKKITILAISAFFVFTSCNENKPTTDEAATSDSMAADTKLMEEPAMDSAAIQAAWGAYMTPSEMHEMLKKGNGTWSADISYWMAPDAPPTKSTGTAKNKMIMGGRYQQSDHTGNMMGMPFEGMSVTGYDNTKKKFESTWIDNMGTGISKMEGEYDPSTKMINFKGIMVDPITGKEKDIRETFQFIDDNTQKLEMFDTKMGKEFKVMEITFTKK